MADALVPGAASRSRQAARDLLAEPPPREESDGWMLGYLDLLTLLLVLFVLLLALRSGSEAAAPSEDATTVMISPLVLEQIRTPDSVAERLLPPIDMPALLPHLLAERGDRQESGAESRQRVAGSALPPRVNVEAARALADSVEGVNLAAARAVSQAPQVNAEIALAIANVTRVNAEAALAAARAPEVNVDAALATVEALNAIDSRLADIEGVQISRERERTILRIEDRLLFPSADVAITYSGSALLDRLLPVLRDFDGEISVEGHTDSRSIDTERFPSNWELSSARASAVLRYLARNGVSSERLRAIGYGATRPLAGNESEAGRAQNRRVELVLSPAQ
ncbi:OmpA family protein [Kushneria aurantia]|uniref:Flagellar motor protein MotB n=1 Tax=Kushneria aurantia TaxID=504092 RepID=A0ABV6G0L3_9GAMM|nr:OmpA family protein [Kushneria aurantia]